MRDGEVLRCMRRTRAVPEQAVPHVRLRMLREVEGGAAALGDRAGLHLNTAPVLCDHRILRTLLDGAPAAGSQAEPRSNLSVLTC